MSWYKNIINNYLLIRESSTQNTQNIINMSLRMLDGGVNPEAVSRTFTKQIQREDPSFDANQMMGLKDSDSLRNFLQTYKGNVGAPLITPPITPEVQIPEREEETIVPDEIVEKKPEKELDVDEISEEEPDTNEISEEGIVGKEEVLTNQLKDPPNFNDRITTDPTLLESFELPVSQVPTIRNKLAKINKKLQQMYYPEIKIEFVGDAYVKPVQWQNKVVKEPYIQVKISGTMPSPSEEIMIKKQVPTKQKDGTSIMKTVGVEPMGVRLIAKVIHNKLSEEEQQSYLQTLPEDSSLRKVILNARSKGETPFFNVVEPLEGAPPIQGKFWYTSPQYCMACKVKKAGSTARKATYIGAVVPPEQMTDKISTIKDDNGQDINVVRTRSVKNKNTGEIEDQPIKVINDTDVQTAAQEQFGGKCIDPFDAVATITALKNWVKNTKKAKENYEKKKSTSKHKGGGWTTPPLPTENLLAVAVNMLRKPIVTRGDRIKYLASWLPTKARAYTRSLQQQGQNETDPYNRRIRRHTPKVTEEDKQIASDAANWWRERLGSLDIETKDKNKISLSVLSTVGTKLANMKDIIEMIEAYTTHNNINLQSMPEEQTPEETISPSIPQEIATPEVPQEANLEKLQDIVNSEDTTPENIVDISRIKEGEHFVSKLNCKKSAEWRTGYGVSHFFGDNNKNKYVIFDKYEKDPTTGEFIKTPSMTFNEGQDYYIEGDRGKYNGKYRTTILNNASVFNSEEEVPEVPEVPETPEVIETPESIETPDVPLDLPSWYGKYDLGKLVEQRLGEGKDPDLVISKFLDSMAMISNKFKNEKFRNNYETTMKQMLRNQNYGGQAALITAIKHIYNQFRPK